MATPKKPNYVVDHKRLYLSVGGKLKHVPQGTPLTLSTEQAEKLGKRVKPIGGSASVDLEAEAKAKAEAGAKAKAEAAVK